MPDSIRALIFDFDGLILDTETPDFQAWQEIYQSYGVELPVASWASYIGGATGEFDPVDYLEAQLDGMIDRDEVLARHRRRDRELIARQDVMPGVEDYLENARRKDLRVGIASSSPRDWVIGHLARIDLADRFDSILTRDEVSRVKPDSELYEKMLTTLDVGAKQAVVLEDSPNGVTAARRAGIFCVAVPNTVTRQLSLDHADLILASLADLPLEELLKQAKGQ
jgi:HAD superfamily hydrolase (TIGR01509 family)